MIPAFAARFWPHLAMALALLAVWHLESRLLAVHALRAADRALYTAAQSEAQRKAIDAVRATEARYAAQAKEADNAHETELADARIRTDAYLGRMRVKAASCAASGTVAAAADHGASVPENVPALVVMDEADVRAAAEWQAYGSACHGFVMGLGK